MIGYLFGPIQYHDERTLTIRVGGVGWRVHCGARAIEILSKKKGDVELYTHLYVREDMQELYGFGSREELRFFELLLSVSGVGPRSAQLILDTLGLDIAAGAVRAKKADVFKRVPGIGTKIAQRIIIDLEPRLLRDGFAGAMELGSFEDYDDALEALRSLGYTSKEAREALEAVSEGEASLSQRVEEALRLLGRSRT